MKKGLWFAGFFYLVMPGLLLGSCPVLYAGTCPWPVFGHDVQHTGACAYPGPSAPLVAKWSVNMWGTGSSPVMGGDGTIYIGANDGLYAITSDGRVKWVFTYGSYNWITSTPAIGSDGTVYCAVEGYLFAIDPEGYEKWKMRLGGYISSAAIAGNGTIYIGDSQYVYAFGPTGRLKWKSGHIGSWQGAPALSPDGGTIYCSFRPLNDPSVGAVAALDAGTGLLKWQVLTPGGIVSSSPAVGSDGTVYFGSWNGYLYAMNPDGSQKWKFKTPRKISTTPSIGSDGTIYFSSGNSASFTPENYLYAVAGDGTLKWKFAPEGGNAMTSQAAIGKDGTLYVGDSNAILYAVNSDGTQKWREPLCGGSDRNIQATPLIGPDGTLYVATYWVNGWLYAIAGSNHPPEANAGPDIALASNQVAGSSIRGTATDSDSNDALKYQWKEGKTLLLDWTPVGKNGACKLDLSHAELQTGSHSLTLVVSDGRATASDAMMLSIANSAPTAVASGGGIYEISTPVFLGGEVSDFDGDALTYEWLQAGNVLFQGQVETAGGTTPAALPAFSLSSLALGVGEHPLTLMVSDGVNSPVSSNIVVKIVDTTPPTLKPVSDTAILWPPNHKMVDIAIDVNAADNSGGPVTIAARVASNEPADGLGDGNSAPDWTEPTVNQASGVISLRLRAERNGLNSGRAYSVTITCTDPSGNSSQAVVEISVPHDKRGGSLSVPESLFSVPKKRRPAHRDLSEGRPLR